MKISIDELIIIINDMEGRISNDNEKDLQNLVTEFIDNISKLLDIVSLLPESQRDQYKITINNYLLQMEQSISILQSRQESIKQDILKLNHYSKALKAYRKTN